MSSSTSQLGLLSVHFPLLIHYTDITIVLPFLKVKGLLTDEDYLQLKKVWCANERRDAVEMLLFTLSRKCPEWELCFVDALYQSLHADYGDYHDGHKHILDTLHGYGVTFEQVKKDVHFYTKVKSKAYINSLSITSDFQIRCYTVIQYNI